MSNQQRKRAVLGRLELDEVLPFVGVLNAQANYKYTFTINGSQYEVRLGSHRMCLFKQNRTCVSCGRVGTYFMAERDFGHVRAHLNLYTDDGILMTKDHIVPKSKGGPDQMHNYQTMCIHCNHIKADKL